MIDLLMNYLLFLAKSLTLVIAIVLAIAGVLIVMHKIKGKKDGDLEINKVNDKLEGFKEFFDVSMLSKNMLKALKKKKKEDKKATSADEEIDEDAAKSRLFVLEFDGDIKASDTDALREEVTAVLTVAKPNDKVLVRIESGGGMVHGYGLAASQLARIREKNIHLIASVDKVAASGGYLMASVANEIIAAPFAIVGSIGVLAQIPNFHKVLKKMDIDFEQLTAGRYKRTLTLFGENTDEAREKMQEDIDQTHQLFKSHVSEFRSSLDIDKVATGEHWYGTYAKELGLVDKLQTSDDFILEYCQTGDAYEVNYSLKQSITDKLSTFMSLCLEKAIVRIATLSTKM